jgi:hypothetical protein
MLGVLLEIAAGLLIAQLPAPAPPPSIAAPRSPQTPPSSELSPAVEDRAAFDRAASLVGPDADAHVRLAIWAERAGWTDARARHLSVALLQNPGHAVARAMLGQVRQGDQWVKAPAAHPGVVEQPALDSAKLDEYAQRRAKARRTLTDQLDLATWCEQNGLPDQAREHLVEAVRIDPRRDATWKRLGYRKVDGRWISNEKAAQLEAFRKAQAAATARWKPVLTRLRRQLGEPSSREAAQSTLADLSDPLAVPAILAVFGGDIPGQRLAVRLLGQIRGPASSQALVSLALKTQDEEVVRIATETLAHREPREFAGRLVAMIARPATFEAQRVDATGRAGQIRVQTPGIDLVRQYQPDLTDETPLNPASQLYPGEFLVWGPDGMPYAGRAQSFFAPADPTLQALGSSLKNDPANAVSRLQSFIRSNPTNGTPLLFNADPWPLGTAGASGNLVAATIDPLVGSGTYVSYRPLTPTQTIAIRNRNALAIRMAQEQLEADVQALEWQNARVRAINERVVPILTASTGQDFGPRPEPWRLWWNALLRSQPDDPETSDSALSPPSQ